MADYVLVHGGSVGTQTWNRLAKGPPVETPDGLMGGRIWDAVAATLEERGHRPFAPTLPDEHDCGVTGHVAAIRALIEENDLKDIILAGHSYGGMIITGVAAQMPERIRRLVYLDAAYPDPGQSLFELLASSGFAPETIPGLEPARAYTEKLQFDPGRIRPLAKIFIRCTQSELAAFVDVSLRRIAAERDGWTLWELPTGHLSPATMPDELAGMLLKAAS
jgi:pimeloyl-ACP methyl ester carboxylesterase